MPADAPTVELDAQYRVLREGAGVLDRSERSKILVRGADAAEYLQGQLTNDVEGLEPGQGQYAALLDRKANIQADMRVLRLAADEVWIDLEAGPAPAALKHLRTYSIGRDVEIEDAGERWAITSVIGPAAGTVTGFEGLGPEHAQRRDRRDGTEVIAVATDLGVDLLSEAATAESLRESLRAAGAEEVSPEAGEILRVESGRPRYGNEISERTMPAEAGIVERAVNFKKGCYIGQEPVARLHYKGRPNRRLVGLRLSAAVAAGAQLRLGEREVGTVGTSVISPAHGPIALAIVRREAEVGSTLELDDGARAEVAELPFADGRPVG
jgi:folate-binding protein YgfZ